MAEQEHIGVVLMTYGSPPTLDDIPAYLKHVRGGREPDEALIIEFRRRYSLIGGSPPLQPGTRSATAPVGAAGGLNNLHIGFTTM